MRQDDVGKCSNCAKKFRYLLIHNGFNGSSYAYCDRCGKTTLLSGWLNEIPAEANLKLYQQISSDVEPFLLACECGGRFTSDAKPRCPKCNIELSPTDAAEFIEINAPGTAKGWRWQRSWDGLYCIVIDNRMTKDNWKK